VSATDYIQPFVIETFGDEQVGFIGIDIAQKTKVSSQPLDTTDFLDEVTTAQTYVNQLTAAGLDKIGLVTHQGYDKDLALASAVSGVDFIIGGDSHTLLGDFAAYGLNPQGPYPTQTTNADGDPVCVGQAWQYSNVVGELNVHFDGDGAVVDCTGDANLLLGAVLENESAVPQADIDAALAADDQLDVVTPDAATEAIIATFAAEVDVLAQEVIGSSTDDLCVARFPSDGRSQICTPEEVPNGGDIQQLVTDAFLARAFRADIALQNSGGVRIDIPAGDITIADAYELLPFANTLYELEMTGAEITLALEQGLGNVIDAGGSTGAYPYGAGIRWDVDAGQSFGNRFSNIEVKPKGATAWTAIDPAATYVVVANSFMVGGGDGYAVLADVNEDGRGVDTFLDYAQSFIDYVVEDSAGTISKPTEYSTQSYTPAP
jgi:5'-nucleotidase